MMRKFKLKHMGLASKAKIARIWDELYVLLSTSKHKFCIHAPEKWFEVSGFNTLNNGVQCFIKKYFE